MSMTNSNIHDLTKAVESRNFLDADITKENARLKTRKFPECKYPHCDQRVLHKPKSCEYCDDFPELQEFRDEMNMNFTGENNPQKAPCPSDYIRGLAGAHVWPGNRPKEIGCTCDKFFGLTRCLIHDMGQV